MPWLAARRLRASSTDALLLGALILALGVLLLAPGPASVHVEGGRYQRAPATVRLRVQITPDADNRAWQAGIESDGFSTNSSGELHGADAARTRWVEFRDVPPGEYVAYVVVHRGAAAQWASHDVVSVL